jgi:hypothetical protein
VIEVTLTELEISYAVLVGTARRNESINKNLDSSRRHSSDVWGIDIEGAAAELAYCKGMGYYFLPTVNTFKAADIGTDVQIRSTKLPDGKLIVRHDDPNEHIYVLVVGEVPDFKIIGYIFGHAAKRSVWLYNPGGREPAYFVPQDALKPLNQVEG